MNYANVVLVATLLSYLNGQDIDYIYDKSIYIHKDTLNNKDISQTLTEYLED